jgi:hypothetical protein
MKTIIAWKQGVRVKTRPLWLFIPDGLKEFLL